MRKSEDRDITTAWDAEAEEAKIVADYNELFRPQTYRQVFFPPSIGEWKVDGSFPHSFFESAKLLLTGVVNGSLREGIEGIAAVFLARHYLELALKYVLFHSRWLADATHNTDDVQPVARGHDLQSLWGILSADLRTKAELVPAGLDMNFVARFIDEFHAYDPDNWRFRYPSAQIAISDPSQPIKCKESLGISFASLLCNLDRAYDVLETLDACLIQAYGENKDWQEEQSGW